MSEPRLRRWAGRAVLVAAVLAAIATSRPRWHLEPTLPPGAILRTPAGGSDGIVLALEATSEPELRCVIAGDAVRLARVSGGFDPAQSGVLHAQYVCPPGGEIIGLALDGTARESGCSSPAPPRDEFLRVTRLTASPLWSRTLTHTFAITGSSATPLEGALVLTLRGAGQALLTARVDGDSADLRVAPQGPNTWALRATAAGTAALQAEVEVRAVVYGACPAAGPCAAPAGDALALMATP